MNPLAWGSPIGIGIFFVGLGFLFAGIGVMAYLASRADKKEKTQN